VGLGQLQLALLLSGAVRQLSSCTSAAAQPLPCPWSASAAAGAKTHLQVRTGRLRACGEERDAAPLKWLWRGRGAQRSGAAASRPRLEAACRRRQRGVCRPPRCAPSSRPRRDTGGSSPGAGGTARAAPPATTTSCACGGAGDGTNGGREEACSVHRCPLVMGGPRVKGQRLRRSVPWRPAGAQCARPGRLQGPMGRRAAQ
jgi:hypothetical protein